MFRDVAVVGLLCGAFVGSLWFAAAFWPFTIVLLFVVWGVRVRNERTFEEEFAMWMKTYGRAG